MARWLAWFFLCTVAACAGATATTTTHTAATGAAAPSAGPAPSTLSAAPSAGPALAVLLRPIATPNPIVHVEVDLDIPGALLGTWRIARNTVASVSNVTARDGNGDIGVRVAAAPPAVNLVLARATKGAVHVAYDIRANEEAPDDPMGQLVLDDRFRGAGEGLVALPPSVEDTTMPAGLRIDGAALRASSAASSLGAGSVRQTKLRPRALRYASFIAGSLGAAVFDDPATGRDEAAWLGYTAFDPRPVAAELAQIRTSFGELFKSRDEPPWTYLFVSQSRPIGAFSTTARAASVLLQVGPSEPWSAGLRLSVAQQLAHRWIGGELRIATEPGREAEGWWFTDGVARYVAMHLLTRLGLLPPIDVREAIAGELGALATSPYATRGNAELAALAKSDEVARATLTARGALYAAREAAELRARSKGEKGLDTVLVALLGRVREENIRALPIPALLDALAKDDPDAARSFDAIIVHGSAIDLPKDTLGPCFRAGTGEYTAFDPGFDVVATREAKDGRVVGLRPGGPAAKAGLREGDTVESMTERDGDADVPVKLVVSRGGSKVALSYAARGARGRGQTWVRVAGMPDEKCALTSSPP
jgi:hypothetical protein